MIHLSLASLILATVLGSIILRFYPDFYFHAEGGWAATKIVILVDLVLGPLLTLVVFKAGKKGLKFDLAVIALIQVTALVYGSHILYSERPAYLAFAIDRFEVASAVDVDYSEFKHTVLAVGPLSAPKTVYVKPPQGAERQQLFQQLLAGGKDLYLLARYYRTFPDHIAMVTPRQLDTTQLFQVPGNRLKLFAMLKKYGGTKSDYIYFPLEGNSNSMLAVVALETGIVITALKIDPWQSLARSVDQ